MSISAMSGGFIKGAVLGAVGILIAPQLTLSFMAFQAIKYATRSGANAHNNYLSGSSGGNSGVYQEIPGQEVSFATHGKELRQIAMS